MELAKPSCVFACEVDQISSRFQHRLFLIMWFKAIRFTLTLILWIMQTPISFLNCFLPSAVCEHRQSLRTVICISGRVSRVYNLLSVTLRRAAVSLLESRLVEHFWFLVNKELLIAAGEAAKLNKYLGASYALAMFGVQRSASSSSSQF